MNDHRPFELGAVYKTPWIEDPVRIIAFDAKVVFYDVWRPDIGDWTLPTTKGGVSYFRMFAPFFLAHANYVRTDEYSEAEFSRHRPDLPTSFATAQSVDWSPHPPREVAEVIAMLRSSPNDIASVSEVLHAPSVYLEPHGPKGSPKPGAVIPAQDGRSISGFELLWQAWRLQAPHVKDSSLVKGVGLHRSGVKKGIPSYYIWGAESRLSGWKREDLH